MKHIFTIFTLLFLFSCEDKPKTITIIGEDSSNLQAMESQKSEFEKANKANISYKAYSFDEAFNKSNLDFINKTGLYDIVLQYNFSLSSFVKNDFVADLNKLKSDNNIINSDFESQLFNNAWKEVGYYYKDATNPDEGIKLVGYPFAANTMLLVYNSEMFSNSDNQIRFKEKYNRDLSVPKTWEEYYQVAEFFTTDNSYGVCIEGAEGGWLYYELMNYVFGQGGTIMDKQYGWESTKDSKVLINSEQNINALKYYLSLKPFNAGNYNTVDASSKIELIEKGNVAMSIVWSDYIYGLSYDETKSLRNKFGFAPIPGDKSALAGGSFYINKMSKNKDIAIAYVNDLMQPKTQIELAKNGLCSPLKSTYSNAEVKQIPYSDALYQSLNRGVYMFEAGPDADVISQTITKYVQQIWKGEISVEDGLNAAQEEVEKRRRTEVFN